MLQNFDVTAKLKNLARRKITAYETAKEFNGLIVALILVKFVIMAVSIYSGYSFFAYQMAGILQTDAARIAFAVVLLAGLEVINAYLLEKFFKFLLKRNKGFWRRCLALFALIALFFSISFYISCRGIELLKSDTAETETELKHQYGQTVADIDATAAAKIAILDKSLSSISDWRGRYSVAQAAKIDSLNRAKIAVLADKAAALDAAQTKYKNDLAAATDAANQTGGTYYNYVAVLMFLQLLLNGVIVFFLVKIFNENETDKVVNESLQATAADFEQKAGDMLDGIINATTNQYFTALNNTLTIRAVNRYKLPVLDVNNQAAPGIPAASITPGQNWQPSPEPAAPHAPKVKINGFLPPEPEPEPTPGEDADQTPEPTPEPATRINENRIYDNRKPATPSPTAATDADGLAVCPVCGRQFIKNHKKQIYCCNDCRYQNQANKTGRPFKMAGKTYLPNH